MGWRRFLRPVIAVAAVAVMLGAFLWHRAGAAEQPAPVTAPDFQLVDPSVPEAKLLGDVLYLDEWRRFGKPVGFAYVPRNRPPGLTSVVPGDPPGPDGGIRRTGNGATLDAYNFKAGGKRLFGAVEFAAEPTSTCADTAELNHAVCVRSGALSPAPADPGMRRLTVYLTADSDAALTGPAAEEIKQFWARTEMVPVGEAVWFTDLVARARAATLDGGAGD